jgi:hypothetical protein
LGVTAAFGLVGACANAGAAATMQNAKIKQALRIKNPPNDSDKSSANYNQSTTSTHF